MAEDINVGAITEALNNKADLDFNNVGDTGKENSIGWGMPDYSSRVSKTINTEYTAEVDGVLSIQITSSTTGRTLVIDGFSRALINSAGAVSIYCDFFISKGSVYKVTGITSGGYFFIPLKGVNL